MGTLMLSEMREEVLAFMGNRSDVTNARIARALNLAQERLARRHDFEELQITVSTAYTYTGNPLVDLYLPMPDSSPYIREIYSVILKDGIQSRKLTRIFTRLWDTWITDPASFAGRGDPVGYTIWDYNTGQAEIFPLPSANCTFQWRLSQWPTPLSADSDKSRFRFKDELLIELAVIYLFNALGKEDDAEKHKRRFSELYLEGLGTDSEKPDMDHAALAGLPEGSGYVGEYWKQPFIRSITDGGE